MTNPIISITNVATGDEVIREMNAKEFAIYKQDQAANKLRLEQEIQTSKAKADLLQRLGITADEAVLLLS